MSGQPLPTSLGGAAPESRRSLSCWSSMYERIAFIASPIAEAQDALRRLSELYGNVPPEDAQGIVALGGDGLVLQTRHLWRRPAKPIYGMHRGTVGFLMNDFRAEGLRERLAAAQ